MQPSRQFAILRGETCRKSFLPEKKQVLRRIERGKFSGLRPHEHHPCRQINETAGPWRIEARIEDYSPARDVGLARVALQRTSFRRPLRHAGLGRLPRFVDRARIRGLLTRPRCFFHCARYQIRCCIHKHQSSPRLCRRPWHDVSDIL